MIYLDSLFIWYSEILEPLAIKCQEEEKEKERQRDRERMREKGKLTSVKLLMPLADEIISKLCLCCCLEANGLFA